MVPRAVAEVMTETTLSEHVRRIAKDLGVLAYHTHDSRYSASGFPDWYFVGTKGQLVRELKDMVKQPTPAQRIWLEAFKRIGVDAGLWRPIDLVIGRIHDELRAIA